MEVMHQSAQLCVLLCACVHIEDIGFIPKIRSHLFDLSGHVVNGETVSKRIVPGDKNHIGLRQFIKILAGIQGVHIHQTAVITGPSGGCPFRILLDLHIKLPAPGILRHTVQNGGPALQIFIVFLQNLLQNLQIPLIHNHLQNIFCTFLFFKHIPHKRVAHERKIFQNLPVPAAAGLRSAVYSGMFLHFPLLF